MFYFWRTKAQIAESSLSMDNIQERALSLHYRRPYEVSRTIQEVNEYFTVFTSEELTYDYENERTENMLTIKGNLPIPSIGRTVPLRIWLPLEFPLEQPIAEIIETESMLRNPAGNLVENNKIQHKYLEEWNGGSNLADFIQVLIIDFTICFPMFDFKFFNQWKPALVSVEKTLQCFPGLIPSWQRNDKYTLVLQLVGRLLVAEQCPVTVRIFLASDFPTEPPNIYMMPDDGISTRRINITDNNGKVIQSYITNWRHPRNSLCKLVQWLVKDWREKCLKKEQSATSKLSSTLRKERSERSHIPHEMSHLLLKHAESSLTEQPKPQPSQRRRYFPTQPPQPAPRRRSPANFEISDFIRRENLSKATEVQLIKNGFKTLNAILCLREADLEMLELQLADLCLLRESLTRLRDDSVCVPIVTNKDERSKMATGAEDTTTTTTTNTTSTTAATTSDIFCRGLRRLLDPIIINERDLDLGVELGKGNFGIVYNGRLKTNNSLNREVVAVKTIKVSSNASEEEVETFVAEILQMSTLKHKNVIELKGLAVIDEMPYLVLPFMTNGDLLGYVKSPQKKLTVEELLKLTLDVACGMQYLSDRQIIHCDLAARNCLVDGDSNAKISDFGMARQLHQSDYMKIFRSKVAARWMAPEIFTENKFTLQSDVWSYGILFWEVLTRGKRPYENIPYNKYVATYIIKGNSMSLPDYVPEKVRQMVSKCWEMTAKSRPSFSDVVCCLNEALSYERCCSSTGPGMTTHLKRPGK